MTLHNVGANAGSIAAIIALVGIVWRYCLRHVVRWCRAQVLVMEKLETIIGYPGTHDAHHGEIDGRLDQLERQIVTTTTTSVAFVPPQTSTGSLA